MSSEGRGPVRPPVGWSDLVDWLPDAVLVTGGGGKVLEHVSPALERVTGVSPERFVERWPAGWIDRFVHVEDREKLARAYLAAVSGKAGAAPAEVDFRISPVPVGATDSGPEAWRWIHARFLPWTGVGGAAPVVCLLRHATEEKRAAFALRDTHKRLSLVFEGLPEAVFILDRASARILDANATALRRYEYTRDELPALRLSDIEAAMPARDSRRGTEVISLAPDSPFALRPRHRTKSGRTFPVDVHAGPATADGRPVMVVIATDASDREESEATLVRLNRLCTILFAANEALLHARDRQRLFEQVCGVLVEGGAYRMAWVGSFHPSTGRVVPVAWAGRDGGYLDGLEIVLEDPARAIPPVADALRTGARSVVLDVEREPRFRRWREAMLARQFRAAASFPLRLGGEPAGVLTLYGSHVEPFGERDLALLDQLATNISARLDRMKATEDLEWYAFHDPPTGLLNRSSLRQRLERGIAEGVGKGGGPLAVFAVGIERFAEVTQALGHDTGHALLRALGERTQGAAWGADVVARLTSDALGVVVPVAAGVEHATTLATAILRAIAGSPFVVGNLPLQLKANVGVALHPEHGAEAETLLHRAEIARSHAAGTADGLVAFRPAFEADPERLTLMADLRDAIAGNSLALHYQPKVSLRTHRTVGAETLVRWTHPRRGPVPPDAFIGLAEQTGVIHELTAWVLDTALAQGARWAKAGIDLRVAINLSVRDLHDPGLPDRILSALARHGRRPDRLIVELTESAVMESHERAAEVLGALHDRGVRVSIDDFGTGHSSLAYLSRLPVSQLKIDRSFVMRMTASKQDHQIVRSIIDLGHGLGLELTAEGVEDEPCLEELTRLGCDLAQGFGIGRPMPPDALPGWLRRSDWQLADDEGTPPPAAGR